MTSARRLVASTLLIGVLSCGASPAPARHPASAGHDAGGGLRIVREPGRAPLGISTREGDPSGAIAAFVATPEAGDDGIRKTVGLAAIFEARLPSARVVAQSDGVRVVAAAADPRELAALVAALTTPIGADVDLSPVRRKLAALDALGREPAELAAVARCEGRLVAAGSGVPTAAEIEQVRAVSVVADRTAFGVVGPWKVVDPPRLPVVGEHRTGEVPPPAVTVYDVGDGHTTLHLVWSGGTDLLEAATSLGGEHSRLALMLAARGRTRLRSVTGTLHPSGACLAVHADMEATSPDDVGAVVALASKEAADAQESARGGPVLAAGSEDAAEQAAIIALGSAQHTAMSPARVVLGMHAPEGGARDVIAHAIDEAVRAWGTRVIEGRVRVEAGQPTSWMLVGSPCGTTGESDGDAGASAVFAVAAARAARDGGVPAEPWIAADGVGILASHRDAAVLADVLTRSFAVVPLEDVRAAQGRLLETAHPALAGLAQAIAPGRPASVLATGTVAALLGLSDAVIAARGEALRRGPLRVAVLSDADAAQADASVGRADRWIARGVARACPAQASTGAPKPGTYAVATDDGSSEAYIALVVPKEAEDAARALASMMDGPGGLLEHALGDGLARTWSARLLGTSGSRSLAIHVEAPAGALDSAVAQTRALLDRLRQGAITEGDLARARAASARDRATALADPRRRLVALFLGDTDVPLPSLDHVRDAAASLLHDDALVIVTARPRAYLRAKTP